MRSNLQNGSTLIQARIEEVRKCLDALEDSADFAGDILWTKEMYCREKIVKCITEFVEVCGHLKQSAERLRAAETKLDALTGMSGTASPALHL